MPEKKSVKKNADEIRYSIIQSAIDLYVNDRNNFTVIHIAQKAHADVSDIYSNFRDKYAIIESFYSTIVPRYTAMVEEISEYAGFSSGEKFANFLYTTFDILDEHKTFVKATFKRMVLIPWGRIDFHKQTEFLLHDILDEDNRIPASNRLWLNSVTIKLLTQSYFQIINLWIKDESANTEKTLALVDKLTSFFNELLYNTTFEKGFDIVRYLYDNRMFMPDLSPLRDLTNAFGELTEEFKKKWDTCNPKGRNQ